MATWLGALVVTTDPPRHEIWKLEGFFDGTPVSEGKLLH